MAALLSPFFPGLIAIRKGEKEERDPVSPDPPLPPQKMEPGEPVPVTEVLFSRFSDFFVAMGRAHGRISA